LVLAYLEYVGGVDRLDTILKYVINYVFNASNVDKNAIPYVMRSTFELLLILF